jgi:putative ABC transport system permease protein
MALLREIGAVTNMGLRSIPQRLASSSVVVIGIAGVVGVLVSVLGMAMSFSEWSVSTGRADRAIVLRTGANVEVSSVLEPNEALVVMDKPGVARDGEGKPLATRDMIRGINLVRKVDGAPASLTIRGTTRQTFAMRPEIELVAGRMFEPGLRELIVGKAAQDEFVGLGVGDTVTLQNSPWSVVGAFVSGDSFESSLLADVDVVLSEYERPGPSSVTVLLESESAYQTFVDAVTTDPALRVDVVRETDYYAQQSQQMRGILNAIIYFVGGIMAVGAIFAALNTMYSAVSARGVEIATLRAIGFGSTGVVVSVLSEALLLALLGAVLGAGVAWLFFGGNTIAMESGSGAAVFELKITPMLLVIGVGTACVVGVLGGLLPAVRAASQPVAVALRSS